MQRVRFRDPDGDVRSGTRSDDGIETGADSFREDDVELLPPVEPGKVVCAARNYWGGISEEDEVPEQPILFLKTPNTITPPHAEVQLPEQQRVLFEGELGIVISEKCQNVSESDAMDVVAGFTCANDITNRTAENIVRRKSFDHAAPIGPAVVPPDQVPDDASIDVRINGELKQASDISQLIFDVPELIASITEDMTLEEDDVILTGSPPGMEPLSDGDRVSIEIEGVGTLEHSVTF